MKPSAWKPRVWRLNALKRSASKRRVSRANVSKPSVWKPHVSRPNALKLSAQKPRASRPNVWKQSAWKLHVGREPHVSKPNVLRPNISKLSFATRPQERREEERRIEERRNEEQTVAAATRVEMPAAEVAAFMSASEPPVVVPMTRTVRIEVPPRAVASTAVSNDVQRLLRAASARGASALFLTPGSRPFIRVEGDVRNLDSEGILSRSDVERIILQIAPDGGSDVIGKGATSEWIGGV